MATHSSILAWEIPWMEEPGGSQAMGSQRVAHNRVTKPETKVTQCRVSMKYPEQINQ